MTADANFRGRLEDARLVTGRGCYGDDLNLPGQVFAAFFRSPVAHADIRDIDVSSVFDYPGVIDVVTGDDIRSLGYGPMPVPPQQNADGSTMFVPEWPPLAQDRVRFVGEAVALVLAETAEQAQDALEGIMFEFDELDPVTCAASEAPVIWPECPGNVALNYRAGDHAGVDAAFARAAHVARAEVTSQRLVVNAMETRAVHAEWISDKGTFVLHAGSQGAAALANEVASIMRLPASSVRVVSRDVGGGFGSKTHAYPEYAALLEAARRVGRPVKWTPTRSEAFQSDSHGRDSVIRGELALDADGRFLAFRFCSDVNIGAYQTSFTTFTATRNFFNSVAGVYTTPVIACDIACHYSNTNPTAPYRGAGRPEANLILERLVDQAAADLAIDRADLRRRNLIPSSAMPYTAANGMSYCSGEFETILDRALLLSDYAGFPVRRAEAAGRGKLRGLGLACYLEIAGVIPVEDFRLDGDADGVVHIHSGLQSNGQGHETVFRKLVSQELDIDLDATRLGPGDSEKVPDGVGSFASRSMTTGGAAALIACASLKTMAISEAAELLQAPLEALAYDAGLVRHAETGQSMTIGQIVAQGRTLSALGRCNIPATFPNGCHIAEVEIDPETGVVEVIAFIAVDDVGNRINPTIVEGQLHGGIAQGLGQFLLEHARYDGDSAQFLTGSFMDYGIPRADNFPIFVTEHVDVPSPNNPLGTKGVGEAGTSGSLAAAYNALVDALKPHGIARFDLPATPPRVWDALQAR